MVIQLINVKTKKTRDIALPAGLWPHQCLEYGRRFCGPNEETNGTYRIHPAQ